MLPERVQLKNVSQNGYQIRYGMKMNHTEISMHAYFFTYFNYETIHNNEITKS